MGTTLDNGDLPDVAMATEADPTGDRQMVALSPATLTALESVTAALDAATLAALETISVANLLNPHPVSVGNFPATQPVSGTFWQATQPVSGPLTDAQLRATRLPVLDASADIGATAVGAAAAAVTLTLPAAGAGLFHHITRLEVGLYSTAARTGAATPITVTTTNLPGNPAFTFATAAAIGAMDRLIFEPAKPKRSAAANTATTVVCPAVTGGLWRLNAAYFAA
jgi:hypothetical protein